MIAAQYPKVYLYRRIVQAKLFIDKNYSKKIDLNNISSEAFFSKFHFIRLFKSIYGRSPHQYLKYVRIEKAKELLKKDAPVSEACYLVGFDSIGSFSTLFSKMEGMSPSTYLKQHQQIKKKKTEKPFTFIPGCYARQHGWLKNSNFEEDTP